MKETIAYDGSENAKNAFRMVAGVEEKPHCGRCDSEGRRLIKFKTPNGETHYLCALCVEQADKREMKFSPLWKRSRRPARDH